jgi:predicted nucleic acid-binding protein
MYSLDTNILIYATNEDALEHAKAQKVIAKLLATPNEWILLTKFFSSSTVSCETQWCLKIPQS